MECFLTRHKFLFTCQTVKNGVNPGKDIIPEKVTHDNDDITGGWYEQDIRQLAAKKIMFGDGNGSYWPNRLVTRAEFANLMSRSLKLPGGNSKFTDLNEAHPSFSRWH